MKNVLTIARKELNAQLNSIGSYVMLSVFVLVWLFMFFRSAFIIGESSLRSLFELLPWMLLVLIPAVTMGSISKEKEEGTVELVLTHPVRDWEFVVGKFLSSLVFSLIPLLVTFPVAFVFATFGKFDWGVFGAQVFGSVLLSMAMVSLGIFISSLFVGQISSLLVTTFALFLLLICGSDLFTQSVPQKIAWVFERITLYSHFSDTIRGVLTFRDILYFVSFSVAMLSLALLQFAKTKFGESKKAFGVYKWGVFMLVILALAVSILGEIIPGRLDLTAGRIYSLSPVTKTTLKNLDDVVTVTLYSSKPTPTMAPLVRDIKDTLLDYKNYGGQNVQLRVVDPLKDAELESEAENAGVQPVQISVASQNEFQTQKSYLGISLSYAGKIEAIPFVQTTNDLEYQLTSLLKKLTTKNKKVVGYLNSGGTRSSYTEYSTLYKELSSMFDIELVNVSQTEPAIPEAISVLIVAGPIDALDAEGKTAIKNFIAAGKNVLFLIDTHKISINNLGISTSENPNSLADLVSSEIGVDVGKNVLYDTKFNEIISLSDGYVPLTLQYPYWLRSVPADENGQVTSKISYVFLPWASSVTENSQVLAQKNLKIIDLLVTSDQTYASPLEGIDLGPTGQPANTNSSKYKTAVAVEGEKNRHIVVGNSEFLSDVSLPQNSQNLAFGLNAVGWLAQETSLGEIKIKSAQPAQLKFKDKTQATFIQYEIMVGSVGVLLIAGGVKIMLRKRKKNG